MKATASGKSGVNVQALRVLACAAMLSLSGERAAAQGQDLAMGLRAGLECAYVDPSDRLASNIARSGAGPVELVEALRMVLADPTSCQAIKTSVEAKLAELSNTHQVVKHEAAVLARQRMENALREADQHAAMMRFVVGPPPPRLTRNHSSVP
jgi:hypothetical protein